MATEGNRVAALLLARRGLVLAHHRIDESLVAGRTFRCAVPIPDRAAARHEFAVHPREGRYFLEDRSGRGTLLEGRRVEGAWLSDGDCIEVGAFRVVFSEKGFTDDATDELQAETLADPAGRRRKLPAQLFLHARPALGGRITRIPFEGEAEVGSGEGCTLRIEGDPRVSRRHARVVQQGERIYVQDVGSKNGTFLRGLEVCEAPLPVGERCRVGGQDLWLAAEAPAAEAEAPGFEGIVGGHPTMGELFVRIDQAAGTGGNVLLHGETGTGKELVARAIHRRSARAGKPYLTLNCAAFPRELIESHLFGHEKGAFTGADAAKPGLLRAADGGTVFLDEIAEMSLELQAKILRAIEYGEILPVGATAPVTVDVRFVAATHRDLRALAALGRFREDLYWRLRTWELGVPPLRQRLDDIPALWDHLLRRHVPADLRPQLTPAAKAKLFAHRWPGNVRELASVAERAAVLMTDDKLRPENLELDDAAAPLPPLEGAAVTDGLTLEEVELVALRAALQRHHGNRSKAAEDLGIARTTLQRKIAAHGLAREGLRDDEDGEDGP